MQDLAPWRVPLAHAQHRNRRLPNGRYLQLATIRQDHRPSNRTVVFRGFVDETNQLKFVTDYRSEKVEQIEACPWGEICWYFPKTREQFRLHGELFLVSGNEIDSALKTMREQAWSNLSASAQLQFMWPSPGKLRANNELFNPLVSDEIPEHFCLLLLEPISVDHLELRGNPQSRYFYRWQDNKWSMEEINP